MSNATAAIAALTSAALIVKADGLDPAAHGAANVAIFNDFASLDRAGMSKEDAYSQIAVAAEHAAAAVGSIKTYSAGTIKARYLSVTATDEHYGKRSALVIGAAYMARTGNREGGAKAIDALLDAQREAKASPEDAAAAVLAMPRKAKGEPVERPLNADDVADYLARVAAQAWEGDDVTTVLAALAKAGKAVQALMTAGE